MEDPAGGNWRGADWATRLVGTITQIQAPKERASLISDRSREHISQNIPPDAKSNLAVNLGLGVSSWKDGQANATIRLSPEQT